MTNYEKYKETIIEILKNGDALALVKGKPQGCNNTDCEDCEWIDDCNLGGNFCYERERGWLESEYKEPEKGRKDGGEND